MRVLVSFAGGRGHLLPLLPLARALRGAGHDLAVSGHPGVVEGVGLGLFGARFPHVRRGGGVATPPADTGTLAPPDLAHERAVVGRWYAGTLGQRLRSHTTEVLRSWRPDLLVCDEMDFGSVAAAAHAGVPSVVVDVIATGALTRRELVAGPLRDLGLDPRAPRGDLAVCPFPASWRDPDFPLRPDAALVRPEPPAATPAAAAGTVPHPAVAWLARGGAPAAYLTLGTVFNRESGDLFARLLDGLLAEPGRVLATVGPDLDPELLRGSGSDRLRVERYVPQDEVLGHVDVVVCHGGSGSVLGALARGVPVVVAPMGADQELNADRVRALGVGAVLDPMTCTPGDVRAAVAHVRADAGVRDALARLRAEIDALPPASTLVPRIEALVHRP